MYPLKRSIRNLSTACMGNRVASKFVGLLVGCTVEGPVVGVSVGANVGELMGLDVGELIGLDVGDSVGGLVGEFVGGRLGVSVGLWVGRSDSASAEGALVGLGTESLMLGAKEG